MLNAARRLLPLALLPLSARLAVQSGNSASQLLLLVVVALPLLVVVALLLRRPAHRETTRMV